MKININGREVGDGCPPFIIAEIGSNWVTLDDCLHSIRQAKLCGADAAKFQLYGYTGMYGVEPIRESEDFEYPEVIHSIAMNRMTDLNNSTLPIDWLPHLKSECDRVGIEFMCSAFSPELVEAVNPFVNVHKVASAECTHVRLLQKLAYIGKPVLISFGGHGNEDLLRSIDYLTPVYRHPGPVVIMYCESQYPARIINIDIIPHLKKEFGRLVGYSDHSEDAIVVPSAAVEAGACVIEKHVTFIDAETPDSPHSLSNIEFMAMVHRLRGVKIVRKFPTERDMILRHNRRLIATQDIAEGIALNEGENFGIYRSLKDDSHAFSPFMVNEVNGRVAKRTIKAGDGIGPGDI